LTGRERVGYTEGGPVMDISTDQVRKAIVTLIAFVLSVTVHEFGHAWMANRLGDKLPEQQGRLTLSPLAHIDPIGTILMPILVVFIPTQLPFIAWGRPVQTNPNAYSTRRFSRRTGHMLVSLAGPAMNLVLAALISLVLIGLSRAGVLTHSLARGAIEYFVVLNLMLLFFNLIPLPPLDGGTVLAGILPEGLQGIPRFLQRYGMLIFFVLLLSGMIRVVMQPAMVFAGAWVETLWRLMAG
jgi:Zn-dependent protease